MKFLRTAILAVMAQCALLLAQPEGQSVNLSQGPVQVPWTSINYYTAGVMQFQCRARTIQAAANPAQQLTLSAASNANPANFTSTGHGFGDFVTHGATMTPNVRISGLTGNWTPCNGSWVATITGADNFTVPCNSTAFGTFAGQAPVAVTATARWNQAVWTIQKFYYVGSDMVGWGWASNPAGLGSTVTAGGSTNSVMTCSNRTAYAYQ